MSCSYITVQCEAEVSTSSSTSRKLISENDSCGLVQLVGIVSVRGVGLRSVC